VIEKILDLPPGIDGLRSTGKLTLEDYTQVVVPLVAGAVLDDRRLRCLVEIPDFAGISPDAAFEDLSLGVRVLRAFDGCAVVTDLEWLADTTRVAAFLMPYPVRVFQRPGAARPSSGCSPCRRSPVSRTRCARTGYWSSVPRIRCGSRTSTS